jgi:hypothetical protein
MTVTAVTLLAFVGKKIVRHSAPLYLINVVHNSTLTHVPRGNAAAFIVGVAGGVPGVVMAIVLTTAGGHVAVRVDVQISETAATRTATAAAQSRTIAG